MKIYNKEDVRHAQSGKVPTGENTTNSTTAEGSGIISCEESKYQRFQAAINVARAKAERRITFRAVLSVVGKYDETARKHFGVSSYRYARRVQSSGSVTVYGKTFSFDALKRTDKNAAASVCVLVDSFFCDLDLLKETQERRKAAKERQERDAFALVAEQLGVSIETLKAFKAVEK